jgi:hypothetical protein
LIGMSLTIAQSPLVQKSKPKISHKPYAPVRLIG